MGCNCNGSKAATQQYVYTSPQGQTTVYTSEVQAKAAQIRNGGGTYVTQAA